MKTGLCAISQPYEMSMFARITIFMSLAVIIGILVVCVIIFIAFWKREGYGEAMLQLVRIMVGVGILLPPKINSARIFVCTVLIFFLNINALFQSQWSSLLTVPVFYSNTDSVEKLRVISYVSPVTSRNLRKIICLQSNSLYKNHYNCSDNKWDIFEAIQNSY